MKLKGMFASSQQNGSLGNWFRNRRFEFLRKRLDALPQPVRILDVGGTECYWVNRGYHQRSEFVITLLNLTAGATQFENLPHVAGDATDLSEYADQSFDLVFSNSVIEHLVTWENQEKMAREVRRVGLRYFVQTPNRYFPIEPHYLLPGMQFLPKRLQRFVLKKTPLSRMQRWDPAFADRYVDEIRLLTRREMKELFPTAEFYDENVGGLTKSFTAHNFV